MFVYPNVIITANYVKNLIKKYVVKIESTWIHDDMCGKRFRKLC
jgi:hypothetical protein